MKFTTTASAALVAASVASAARVLEIRQNTIVIPGTDDIKSDIKENFGDASSDIADFSSKVSSKANDILSDASTDINSIGTKIKDTVTGGLTINIPALPTIVDKDPVKSLVSKLRTELNPDWVSSLENGQTPSEVASWLDTVPTQYSSDVKAAISSEFPTVVRNTDKTGDKDESKAVTVNSGLGFFLISAAAGVVGLAIAL